MFTVLICDKNVIDECYGEFNVYLKPFLDNPSFAFCRWNPQGTSISDAVPELFETIKAKKEWQAVIIYDKDIIGLSGISRANPFDFAKSVANPEQLNSSEEILKFREDKKAAYNRALDNPLVKLSSWILGLPIRGTQLPEEYSNLPDASDENYFEVLDDERINPLDLELEKLRIEKQLLLEQNFSQESLLFVPPKQVIVVAERVPAPSSLTEDISVKHDEFEYSRFYEDNLYNDKLRYLLSDVSYVDGARNASDYLKFLIFILLLAGNDCPISAIRVNRVYKVNTLFNQERLAQLYYNYHKKLAVTGAKLRLMEKRALEKEKQELSSELARILFEKDIVIPVHTGSEYRRGDLMSDYRGLGLASDCPRDEEKFWDNQYHTIGTRFIRYLREPRRAVEMAVKLDLHKNNKITDERAIQLNEYQREDIEIHLNDAEHKMVKTVTTKLYDTAKFNEQLDKADKELRHEIGQRMTKKQTIFLGITACLAFLFGFLPLLFSNLNTAKSFLFSLTATGIAVGLLALVGFVFLLVKRVRMANMFKKFNAVMNSIINEIESGLGTFSTYLSHACSVMRSFSVLKRLKHPISQKRETILFHEAIVDRNIKEAQKAFSGFVSFENVNYDAQCDAYNHDFSKMEEPEYQMPYEDIQMSIEFLQQGFMINVPVDYLEVVTMTREELYD